MMACGAGLAVSTHATTPFSPSRSARSLRRARAACGRLRTLTAALRRGAPVSGNPARHRPEFAMSLSSTSTACAVDALLVRDVDGQYRPARAEEVLSQARRLLADRVRRGATMSSPEAVKDHLRLELGVLEHEVFCVLFLDAAHFGERDRRFRDRDRFEVGAGLRGEDCRDEVVLRG